VLPNLQLEGGVLSPMFRPDNLGNKRWGSDRDIVCSLSSLSGGCVL